MGLPRSPAGSLAMTINKEASSTVVIASGSEAILSNFATMVIFPWDRFSSLLALATSLPSGNDVVKITSPLYVRRCLVVVRPDYLQCLIQKNQPAGWFLRTKHLEQTTKTTA
jgi:hypothetical protein